MSERLMNLLNAAEVTEATGTEIVKEVGRAFNCFTSYKRLARELYESLGEVGKKRLLALWSACGLYFAYYYITHDYDRWDLRDKASHEFSFKNLETLERLFHKATASAVTLSDKTAQELKEVRSFSRLLADCGADLWIQSGISEWVGEHPTLRQAFFSGFYNGVVEEMVSPAAIVPNGNYGTVVFPFI